MRTTVTLDADTELIIRRRMQEQQVSFKQALNDAIRDGSRDRAARKRFRTRTASMGTSRVNLDRALQLDAALEDEERVRKMRAGK